VGFARIPRAQGILANSTTFNPLSTQWFCIEDALAYFDYCQPCRHRH
jgi:hypothetical protein